MGSLRRYLFSILLIGLHFGVASAQDSVEVAKQNVLHFTVDYGKFFEPLFGDQKKWEVGVGFLMADHYNVTIEYGAATLKPENVINNGSYTATGSYWRAGFDYFIKATPRAYLSFGLLYANSSFDDEVNVKISSEIWEDLDETFNRYDLKAQWLELVVSSEGPIFKKDTGILSTFYWGTKFRVRVMVSETNTDQFEIYAVPGFGRRFSDVVPAVNLFLKFRFPL